MVLAASWGNVKNSTVGARGMGEVIERAASLGDYELAEKLYKSAAGNVLGAESELEDVIYPEKVVERRIGELEEKLVQYLGNREIYLAIADLYEQLGEAEKSGEYREKARVLDPNNSIFQP